MVPSVDIDHFYSCASIACASIASVSIASWVRTLTAAEPAADLGGPGGHRAGRDRVPPRHPQRHTGEHAPPPPPTPTPTPPPCRPPCTSRLPLPFSLPLSVLSLSLARPVSLHPPRGPQDSQVNFQPRRSTRERRLASPPLLSSPLLSSPLLISPLLSSSLLSYPVLSHPALFSPLPFLHTLSHLLPCSPASRRPLSPCLYGIREAPPRRSTSRGRTSARTTSAPSPSPSSAAARKRTSCPPSATP